MTMMAMIVMLRAATSRPNVDTSSRIGACIASKSECGEGVAADCGGCFEKGGAEGRCVF